MAEIPRSMQKPVLRGQSVVPLIISMLGVMITIITWSAVRVDLRTQVASGIDGLAEESRGALQRRVDQHILALKNLARLWQLHGTQSDAIWHYETRMLMEHFPALAWIAWIQGNGDSLRYEAQDSTWVPPQHLIEAAVQQQQNPGREFMPSPDGNFAIQAFLPVRPPQDSVGTLASAIRSDSLFGGATFETARGLAFVVRSDDGREIFRRGPIPSKVPEWMKTRGVLPLSTGGFWTVEYVPTDDYMARTESTWPNFVLITGLLFSLGIGAIAWQVLRVRGFSAALERTNMLLDKRVDELMQRDRDLSRLNEELEGRVEQRTVELRDAMTELEAFSHSISHDLRSPVGAMLNYAAILREDYGSRVDEEGLRVIDRLQRSGESAIALLDDLMQLARAGQSEPLRQRVDMTELARLAYSVAASDAGDVSNVRFELSELPQAWGDPSLIERIFTNIFTNALKYTRECSERHIAVSATTGADANTYMVKDNGVGFPPEVASSLFEPFQRKHAAARFPGTGLGLAIVARIVRRLGGTIAAESDGQRGARFSFTLPSAVDGSQ